MAVVSMLAGGMVGFFSAVFSLIALNVTWMTALGLWWGVGSFAALAVLAMAMLPRRSGGVVGKAKHA
jgi:membrane protein implicated in regulation of membrane protease activity